jgi:SAM-dependent methyltransferase
MFRDKKRFSCCPTAMVLTGVGTIPALDAYDFEPFRTIVDVGGGSGLTLSAILRRHPWAQGVLFDLPDVAKRAVEVIARTSVSGHCRIVGGGDFFESVPTSGDAYLLRHVLHDWDDREAISILENCRHAMRPGGRVLVVETVIPSGNDPCFGKWLDLMMLVVGAASAPKSNTPGYFPRRDSG